MRGEGLRAALAELVRTLAVPILVISLAGCSGESPQLVLENGTDLEVTLVLNGQALAVALPDGGVEIAARELPPLPWRVEATSPSGRVMATMKVQPGDLEHTTEPGGGESFSGRVSHEVLSCGQLIIWAGYSPPSVPAPAPDAGKPGDCEP
jgi:hypothetical protein